MTLVTLVESFERTTGKPTRDNTRFSSIIGEALLSQNPSIGLNSMGASSGLVTANQIFFYQYNFPDFETAYAEHFSKQFATFEDYTQSLINSHGSLEQAKQAGALQPNVRLGMTAVSQRVYIRFSSSSGASGGEKKILGAYPFSGTELGISVVTTYTDLWTVSAVRLYFGAQVYSVPVQIPDEQWLTASMSQTGTTVTLSLRDSQGAVIATKDWELPAGDRLDSAHCVAHSQDHSISTFMDNVQWTYDEPGVADTGAPDPSSSGDRSVKFICEAGPEDPAQIIFYGPDGDMFLGEESKRAFKIDQTKNTPKVAMGCETTANVTTPVWAQVFIQWFQETDDVLVPVGEENVGPRASFGTLVQGDNWFWTPLRILLPVPDFDFTHFRPGLRFYRSSTDLLAPAVNTTIYIDKIYVPDGGYSIDDRPYLDGDQEGAYWEGIRSASTSVYGVPEPEPEDKTGAFLIQSIIL